MGILGAFVFSVIGTAVLSGSVRCHAQFNKSEEEIAFVMPLDYGEPDVLREGAWLWTNRGYSLNSKLGIPTQLLDRVFIRSIAEMSDCVVIQPGYLYVMTPKAGMAASVASELLNQGFEKLDAPTFYVANVPREEIEVYKKYVEKGERVKYGFYGITVANVVDDLEAMLPGIDPNISLSPPDIELDPGSEYLCAMRRWQGIPGIERTSAGKLWIAWYGGGLAEGPDNYVVLVSSNDAGETWSSPHLVINPHGTVRAFDPVLWHDPHGRLWVFWNQGNIFFDGRVGVWAIVTENPDDDCPKWSQPRRLADGVMMNKPTVLSTGEWLLPAAVWNRWPRRPDMDNVRYSNVYVSYDDGRVWTLFGSADVPERGYDEHMIVERKDGSLWMLVRTIYGIGQSFSYDGGKTWTVGEKYMDGPSSRFHIRRLQSGKLLLIYHHSTTERTNLTAYLSANDGKTWYTGLLLDDRPQVTYPDAVQTEDGTIYVIYDYERFGSAQIVMAKFREEDIEAGAFVTAGARSKVIVNRLR